MKPAAIVYTSNTGHTRKYALLLGEQIGLPVYSLDEAISIPEGIPLFTLQGGIDRSRLKGMDKLMISMLTKGLASQKQRSAQEERMLELLSRDESYVSSENIAAVLQWYREEQL